LSIAGEDEEMLNNFKEFTGWAGRYPYPKEDTRVKEIERRGRNLGKVGLSYKKWAHKFIEREVKLMTE
jgi:predicted TIM-barrel fold metal-dependent hydrolase